MAQTINMPKEGITVESCLMGAWKKDIGDAVAADEVLFEYETDKAAFECLSTANGVLLHKFYDEGDEAPVLMPVAIVGEAGEDISDLIAGAGAIEKAEEAEEAEEIEEAAEQEKSEELEVPDEIEEPEEQEKLSVQNEQSEEDIYARLKISPRARDFAEEHGVDLSKATPSGPDGRIVEADVIAAANAVKDEPVAAETIVAAAPEVQAEAPPEPENPAAAEVQYMDEQFTQIRTVIAKTMAASLQRSAQLTHHHSFDATSVLAMREDFKAGGEELGYAGVSIGDIILYVTSRILAKHPEINALVAETGIRKFYTVNLGVAVDTPRGLMVPTIFGAEKKTLKEISEEVKTLAGAAQKGRVNPDQLTGGTFTVSNLGATGVEVFTPIINPPQAAIAGITGIVERVRKGRDGQIEIYPSIGISLTYDHRAVDGAPASRFAAELCNALAGFSWKTLALEFENERRT